MENQSSSNINPLIVYCDLIKKLFTGNFVSCNLENGKNLITNNNWKIIDKGVPVVAGGGNNLLQFDYK